MTRVVAVGIVRAEMTTALRTGGSAEQRRLALVALGGVLLTLRTAAPDSLNGSLLAGWCLTLGGLAIVMVGLRRDLQIGARAGRLLLALLVALGLGGGAIAATQALSHLAAPGNVACRDDVAIASAAGGRLLREGRNPYSAFDSVAEQARCGTAVGGTVLRQGHFADRTLLPSDAEIRAAEAAAAADPSRPEVERRLAYPAGSVLAGVAGERGLVLLVVAALALGMVTVLRRTPADLRGTAALALLAQLAVWTQVGNGHADGIAIGLLVAAWAAPETIAGALLLGLACATKQTAWFMVPAFMATAGVRGGGPRAALRAAGVAGLAFACVNVPFLAASPAAYLRGVLSPALDGLFPLGAGAVGLVTSGVLPAALLPLFTAAMYAVAGGAAWLAWRFDARRPGIGAAVAAMALWVGPRSLLEYMAGAGLLAVTVCATRPRSAAVPAAAPLAHARAAAGSVA